jgi:RNA 2',3'-cyclic 3'-phosphodiesterase
MSRGATARLFVAIEPPVEVREELGAWARDALAALGSLGRDAAGRSSARLLEPHAMHLTLCFLGSRPAAEIEAISAALETCVTTPAGELSLGAPLWLPPRRPHALAVEIRARGDHLARLQEAVVSAIAGMIDWQPERRRFRAHVTVARIRGRGARGHGGAGEMTGAEQGLPATPPRRFTPASVVLYRSWLAPAGATYEALHTRPLSSGVSRSGRSTAGTAPGR